MSRLTPKQRDELNEGQQEQFDRLCKFAKPGADGQLGGPFDPWVRSPEVAQRIVSLSNFVWERTTLGRDIVELAIIITGRYWRSNVEWVAHAKMAKDAGIPQEVIDAVFEQRRPEGASEKILATYDFCHNLHETKDVPREIYDRAVDTFGEQGVVELITTIGLYTMVSMTLNTFNIGLGNLGMAPDQKEPFPRNE
ncbi:MAG: carboxymuconolactone decarboxylase family protein [Pseudomonadales bacterium]|nr:carboxymuconolactone decarboxylase family protein [Pseudomonadales bacterium]